MEEVAVEQLSSTLEKEKKTIELESEDDDDMDNWAESLKNLEKNYDIFYTEQVSNINVYFFYVNKGELEKVRQENIDINNGALIRDQLIYIINDNKYIMKCKYYLSAVLKYNVSLEPGKIYDFLTNEDDDENYQYLQKLKTVDTIRFSDTITMFNDFNSLYIIFNKTKPVRSQTKKVSLGRARMTKKKELKD